MDGYPSGSLDHNVPFLVASGLNDETPELQLPAELQGQTIQLRSELPPLDTREAKVLEGYFGEIDVVGKSWAGVERDEPYRFRIRTVGRTLLLPPRRASLPESDEPFDSPPVLHSPFSPLSPVSPIYPDGLIDAQWIKKHQELVPSIWLCFYALTTDPTTTTLQDNRLKNDIAELRAALSKSGYRTRLAVALLSDDDTTPATLSTGLQERLENIRKGSGLDPKSLFYIPPQETPADLKSVADNILSALYGTAVEYYRDLSRHARKKRSRGVAPPPTVPPTTGTSRTLSLPDWNFRYDFKSAVLGEFRQEYDAAIRSFEQAYEVLLGQDVLDIIPSWSPRWNEARLLSDIIAIRCLRIHLWLGQPTLAVRRWQAHRDRIGLFLDRRGLGTQNYGWQAWEARWAMVMADLIDKVELGGLEPSGPNLFLQPEKAVAGDRLQPWELLHHKGYWYRNAARHLLARRTLAHSIPEEDRTPPEESTVSGPANNAYNYDTYMCPEPYEEYPLKGEGVNHSRLIIDCLLTAQSQFQARQQTRTAAELSLDCAKEMANLEAWEEVLSILRPLWENLSFRADGWLDISEDLCWLVRRAAVEEERVDLIVAVDWQLMNKKFTRRPNWHYDLTKSLENIPAPSPKTVVSLSDDTTSTFVVGSFVFRNKESRAGDTCLAQLSITSEAFDDAASVVLDSIQVNFDGGLKSIVLEHEPSEQGTGRVIMTQLSLKEDFSEVSEDSLSGSLKGHCDLTIAPGKTRVIEMRVPLREAGPVTASSLKLSYRHVTFDLDYTMKLGLKHSIKGWYNRDSLKPSSARSDAHVLQVHPRPPKMEIKLAEPLQQFYANESVKLQIQIKNAEDEAANVKLNIHLFGKTVSPFQVQFADEQHSSEAVEEESRITNLRIGTLSSSSVLDVTLSIDPTDAPTTYDLHIRLSYHLESDSATPISQTLPITLNVVNAFEANYDLIPRLNLDAWPSLFDYEGIHDFSNEDAASAAPSGLSQSWSLVCHYASFALEELKVVGVEAKVLSIAGSARCNVIDSPSIPNDGITLAPKTMNEARFNMTAQKLSLDDRQPVSIDLAFIIRWKRQNADGDNTINTTTMLAGHYLILGSEPRVLASAYETDPCVSEAEGIVHLDITIENPSSHFLTFGLAMEPSDEFAFSGAKQTTMHLLPMSRRVTSYRLLPFVRGDYIRPGLLVRDKYFQKVLRIIPTDDMKIDKDGLLVWVPPLAGKKKVEES